MESVTTSISLSRVVDSNQLDYVILSFGVYIDTNEYWYKQVYTNTRINYENLQNEEALHSIKSLTTYITYQFNILCRTIYYINYTYFSSFPMNWKRFQITRKTLFHFISIYSSILIYRNTLSSIIDNAYSSTTNQTNHFFWYHNSFLLTNIFSLSIHSIHTTTNRVNTFTESSFLCLFYSTNKHIYRNRWHEMDWIEWEMRKKEMRRGNEWNRMEWIENRNQGVNGVLLVWKYRNIHPYSL